MAAPNATEGLPPPIDVLITSGRHLRAEDSTALAAMTVLYFDHLLTFSDEVRYIWMKKKSLASFLFLFNRYFAPIGFAMMAIALFSPDWTLDTCRRFAKFEGVLTMVVVLIANCLLTLRVYAIHGQNKLVLGIMSLLFIAEASMMGFTLAHSGPVIIPPSPTTYGCVLVSDPKIGNLDVMFVVPTIVFDTSIFILLLIGIYQRVKSGAHKAGFITVLFRDGILYFIIMFSTNVAWTATGLNLSGDLKNVLSTIATAGTVVFIGRLTLNLKKQMDDSLNSTDPFAFRSSDHTLSSQFAWKKSGNPSHGTNSSNLTSTAVELSQMSLPWSAAQRSNTFAESHTRLDRAV